MLRRIDRSGFWPKLSLVSMALVPLHPGSWAGIAEDVIVRVQSGIATCVVRINTADPLTVLVRTPPSPAPELLGSLPEQLRDFSTRPIHVLLLPAPGTASGAPRRPTKLDPTPIYPVVGTAVESSAFITVAFNADWLAAGTEIVAERSVTAPTGERIATQTRCPVTAADASRWRF